MGGYMKKILMLFTLLISIFSICFSDEFSPDSIKSLIRKVAQYAYNKYGDGTAAGLDNDWSESTIMTGIMGAYRVTKDQKYLSDAIAWGNAHSWSPKSPQLHPDNMCCMQTYCESYIYDPLPTNTSRYTPSKNAIDPQLFGRLDGAGWFWWEDGLYMGPPAIAMLGYITGEQRYFDSLTSIILSCKKAYYDTVYHFWYWKKDWVYPLKKTPQGNPEFWGPGNAWVIGGMIRSMNYMPQNYSKLSTWLTLYRELCEALRAKQAGAGYWRTSLYDTLEFPNPESSCTSFFIYAFSCGILKGWLDKAVYEPVVRKAWSWLVKAVDANGKVGYGQPWSNQPGSPQLFNEIPEGYGAFLLAAEGVYNLVTASTSADFESNFKTNQKYKTYNSFNKIIILNTNMNKYLQNTDGYTIYSLLGKRICKTNNEKNNLKHITNTINIQNKRD